MACEMREGIQGRKPMGLLCAAVFDKQQDLWWNNGLESVRCCGRVVWTETGCCDIIRHEDFWFFIVSS